MEQLDKINSICKKLGKLLNNKINEEDLKLNNDEMVLEITRSLLESMLSHDKKQKYNITEHKKLLNGNVLIKSSIPGQNNEKQFFI